MPASVQPYASSADRQNGSDRVVVTLKPLIDLAKPAAAVDLHHPRLRALSGGAYVSRFKGRGMEFDETRLYQPGDDIRSIDWRVTARTGKPHTKLFREERERPVFIATDHRHAMYFATRGVFKSVQAAKLTALIAWAAQHHGDRIGGQLFSASHCTEVKPQNGRHAVLRLLNMLTQPTDPGIDAFPLSHALARLVQHVRPGSLVYIISDFRGFNEQAEGCLAKLAQHCGIMLIFVHDPLESQLPDNGRYRFTDGLRDVVVDSADTHGLLHYRRRFSERRQRLEQFALNQGLALLFCSTTEDPLQCLLGNKAG